MLVTSGRIQAKHISDSYFLETVQKIQDRNNGHPALINGMTDEMVIFPWKVVLAKARKLILRGLLDGCYCGCRGDFEIPREYESPWPGLLVVEEFPQETVWGPDVDLISAIHAHVATIFKDERESYERLSRMMGIIKPKKGE